MGYLPVSHHSSHSVPTPLAAGANQGGGGTPKRPGRTATQRGRLLRRRRAAGHGVGDTAARYGGRAAAGDSGRCGGAGCCVAMDVWGWARSAKCGCTGGGGGCIGKEGRPDPDRLRCTGPQCSHAAMCSGWKVWHVGCVIGAGVKALPQGQVVKEVRVVSQAP